MSHWLLVSGKPIHPSKHSLGARQMAGLRTAFDIQASK